MTLTDTTKLRLTEIADELREILENTNLEATAYRDQDRLWELIDELEERGHRADLKPSKKIFG